jgi:hypothetical protein
MTIASDLLQQHIQTLVDDNARWQTLIADDLLRELAYTPARCQSLQGLLFLFFQHRLSSSF